MEVGSSGLPRCDQAGSTPQGIRGDVDVKSCEDIGVKMYYRLHQ